jgi:predicted dehydrogenase
VAGKSGQVGWGICGIGFAARGFARSLRVLGSGDARLAAVASSDLGRAQEFARVYGAGRACQGIGQLLADPMVDIVYIATPAQRHRDDCIAALDAGKAVLCEKPFTTTAPEAQQVMDAARNRQLFCMEAMWMRFHPLVQRCKSLVVEGAIGTPRMLLADFAVPVAQDPISRLFDPKQAGGTLLDRGVYCVSLAHHLLGVPQSISALVSMTASGVDGQSSYILTFAGGAVAILWSSIVTAGSNEAVIIGTNGQIRLHEPFFRPSRLTLWRKETQPGGGGNGIAPSIAQRLKEHPWAYRILQRLRPLFLRADLDLLYPIRGPGYHFEAAECIRCLREGLAESKVMPLDETLRVMQTMDQIRSQWKIVDTQEIGAAACT